jgi:hypothetical protein
MKTSRNNTAPFLSSPQTPPFPNTQTHTSSIQSSVRAAPAFNWIQWCTRWIKLSLPLNEMLLVGGGPGCSSGGLKGAGLGGLRCCRGHGSAAPGGDRVGNPSGAGLPSEESPRTKHNTHTHTHTHTKRKKILSNKDIPDWMLTDPFP